MTKRKYHKYLSNSELAKIFNYSSAESMNRSTRAKRFKESIDELITLIENSIISSIKK